MFTVPLHGWGLDSPDVFSCLNNFVFSFSGCCIVLTLTMLKCLFHRVGWQEQ